MVLAVCSNPGSRSLKPTALRCLQNLKTRLCLIPHSPLSPHLHIQTFTHVHSHPRPTTGDPTGAYRGCAANMLAVLNHSWVGCGYAPIADVATGSHTDLMESYFLSEVREADGSVRRKCEGQGGEKGVRVNEEMEEMKCAGG